MLHPLAFSTPEALETLLFVQSWEVRQASPAGGSLAHPFKSAANFGSQSISLAPPHKASSFGAHCCATVAAAGFPVP